jgi:hypothetical protein
MDGVAAKIGGEDGDGRLRLLVDSFILKPPKGKKRKTVTCQGSEDVTGKRKPNPNM